MRQYILVAQRKFGLPESIMPASCDTWWSTSLSLKFVNYQFKYIRKVILTTSKCFGILLTELN